MKRRVPIVATLIVAAAVATMIALGVWQLRRAEWKEDLLAQYRQAQAMSSNVPWPRSEAELERALFRWSQFDCQRVLGIRVTAATSADGEPGVAQVARCAIDGGGEAEVALGWSGPTGQVRWEGGEVSGIHSAAWTHHGGSAESCSASASATTSAPTIMVRNAAGPSPTLNPVRSSPQARQRSANRVQPENSVRAPHWGQKPKRAASVSPGCPFGGSGASAMSAQWYSAPHPPQT